LAVAAWGERNKLPASADDHCLTHLEYVLLAGRGSVLPYVLPPLRGLDLPELDVRQLAMRVVLRKRAAAVARLTAEGLKREVNDEILTARCAHPTRADRGDDLVRAEVRADHGVVLAG